jgi:hypothetical protein
VSLIRRTSAAALPILVLLAVSASPADASATPAVTQLLADAKSQASLLKSDLETLDFFASASGTQGRSGMAGVYSDRIAALRNQAGRLTDARKDASHWQQVTIDRVVPLLQELASRGEAATRAAAGSKPSPEYLRATSSLARALYLLISASIDYGNAMEELDRVTQTGEAAH